MTRRETCTTVAAALASITSLEELEGFVAALRDPGLQTLVPTEAEWQEIARRRIAFQRDRRPR